MEQTNFKWQKHILVDKTGFVVLEKGRGRWERTTKYVCSKRLSHSLSRYLFSNLIIRVSVGIRDLIEPITSMKAAKTKSNRYERNVTLKVGKGLIQTPCQKFSKFSKITSFSLNLCEVNMNRTLPPFKRKHTQRKELNSCWLPSCPTQHLHPSFIVQPWTNMEHFSCLYYIKMFK